MDRTVGKKTKVIACGVFENELEALNAEAAERPLDVELLDAGLHARPKELKARLQAAIDATDAAAVDRIAILYGLCGRGAVGLVAREVPVVLPRVHDCVAVFLGEPDEYWRQFKKCPGTFYMTPGWFEKKAHPDQYRARSLKKHGDAATDPNYAEWAAKYGPENAAFISDFFQSWRNNYRRIALINNSLGDVPTYREHARLLADVSGWTFEELAGDLAFIRTLVFGPHDEQRFLVVPPHHMVIATNDTRIFTAVPAHPSEEDVLNARRVMSGVTPGKFIVGTDDTPAAGARPAGLGLGIDAGGTYTDAVIIDLADHTVFSKAKAPTTHHDLSIGVEEALGQLDPALLPRINLVSLSTTLATNAIVEGRGAHVGLILMPLDPAVADDINVRPLRVVPGRLTIDGHELAPVDPEAVRQTVRDMLDQGIEAFAVSGYAGAHNPEHEKAVKKIIRELANVPVVCGHELSSKLNFVRRAHTAVLNAKLMPIIDELLRSVEIVLRRFGIHAPVFIVRGDGSLIETAAARERAIETILSGPAASAIGAHVLTKQAHLLALDMGGTTTDVAVVAEGMLKVCDEGAVVGPWQTSVSAADILTTGLGGDSYVRVLEGGLKISVGPERVIPLSFLAMRHPAAAEELAALANSADADTPSPFVIEFFDLVGLRPGITLSDSESRVFKALARGPLSRMQLAGAIGAVSFLLLPTARLEELGVIRRSAFTPTDALHVLGTFANFHAPAARSAAAVLARFCHQDADEFARRVCAQTTRRLAYEIARREISLSFRDPARDSHPMVDYLMEEFLRDPATKNGFHSLHFRQHRTVVGIGAPAGAFLPDAGRLVEARVIVPTHAEVANALGAISGKVIIRETISIRPDEAGSFIMMSPLGRKEFGRLADAQNEATGYLVHYLREKAGEFGTNEREVMIHVTEKTGQLADGSRQFLELLVEGMLVGAPRAAAQA